MASFNRIPMTYTRYAKTVFISNVDSLDCHLKVVDDLGNERSDESL